MLVIQAMLVERAVIVDDVDQPIDIKAAREHIRGDENVDYTLKQTSIRIVCADNLLDSHCIELDHRLLPLACRALAVDGHCREIKLAAAELERQSIRRPYAVGEDKCFADTRPKNETSLKAQSSQVLL